MKKHINCHYKNGSLLFCTNDTFPPGVAGIILDIFNQQGLLSILELKAKGCYKVVGKMNVNYDPFEKDHVAWSEVVSKMTITMEVLEAKLKPLFTDRTPANTSKYFRL